VSLPACLPSSSAHKLAHASITGTKVNLSGPMSFSYISWKSSIVKINPKPETHKKTIELFQEMQEMLTSLDVTLQTF
jgi:hypothetical protein